MDKETLLFLTINELKFIANKFNIDFKIYYENLENKIIFTGTYNDKITIVEKIIKKDTTKSIYKKNNVAFTIKEKLTPNDLVLYNEFKSTNTAVLELTKNIKNFKFGQICFYLARFYWIKNKPLTYSKLFELYEKNLINPDKRMKESFMFNKVGIKNWEELQKKAREKVRNYYKINIYF